MTDRYVRAAQITPGTPVAAADGCIISATVAGTQNVKINGGVSVPLQVAVGSTKFDGLAVTDAPAGGTATATVFALYAK